MQASEIIWLIIISLLTTTSCTALKGERNLSSSGSGELVALEEEKERNKTDLGIEGKDYKPGEVLVKFKRNVSKETIERITKGSGLEIIRIVSPPSLYLLKIIGDSTVRGTIKALKEFQEIEYSEPNYISKIDK